MRSRDWRRFQKEKVYRRRIKYFSRFWFYCRTANGDRVENPIWLDFIGTPDFFFYKSGTTKTYRSKNKVKYSPNKSKSYYRDPSRKRLSFGNRERDKVITYKIIKEYLNESK